MSVLKGEGKVPILFGSTSISVGTLTHRGYLARPDLAGEWPTVVVVPSAWGVTSSAKDVCRRIARRGLAALAVDLFGGDPPARTATREAAEAALAGVSDRRALAVLADVAEFIANRAGFWSSAEHGFGLFGVGSGGRLAAMAADGSAGVAALALVSTPLTPPAETGAEERQAVADVLERLTVPVLGMFGKGDEVVPLDEVTAVRSRVPHAEWVLYNDVGHDFMDDFADGYDDVAFRDVIERVCGFFEKHLPAAPNAEE